MIETTKTNILYFTSDLIFFANTWEFDPIRGY